MASRYSRRQIVERLAGIACLNVPAAALAQQSGQTGAVERPFRIIADDPSFERLVSPDAALETIVTFPRLRGEGPIWRGTTLWFSEMRERQVIEVRLDGSWRVVAENAGGPPNPDIPTLQGPNGLANWRNGCVLLCRQGSRDLGILHPDGRMETFIANYQGLRFNSPNDTTASSDGTVWFTDPPFALPGHPWARPADPEAPPPVLSQEIPFCGVYRFKNGRLRAAITDMTAPDGIALSPDERTLYVNNATPEMNVRAYTIGRNGRLSEGREVFRLPPETPQNIGLPDGLKVDVEGNLWMSGQAEFS